MSSANVGKVFNMTGGNGGGGTLKLETLTITKQPNKTVYKSGESFDPTGMIVTAGYGYGLTSDVTGYSVSPQILTDGVTEVTVTYTEWRVTKTAMVSVTVEKVLVSIAVTTNPSKMAYSYLESFDPAGMVVTATYSDESTEEISGYTYPETAFSTLGQQAVELSYAYEGVTKTTSLNVTVNPIEVAVPVQNGMPVYDGTAKTPSWTGYDSVKMTMSGETNGVNAGTYTAKFVLGYGYVFPGNQDEAEVEWTIGKGDQVVSVSPQSVTLNTSTRSAKFTVTRKGDGVISATSGNPSVATIGGINQQTGEVTVNSVNDTTGTAVITVKVAAGTNYLAGADKEVQVNAQFVTIYGVEWDWTSGGSTKGTRTDGAAGFSDPNPAVNNGSGSSPFDNLYPWSGMVKETRAGGVMVKEPKYWYKWTKTGKKLKLQIADGPVEGFHVDPVNMDRGDGLGELDFSYIGRYHCASGTYKSETNKAQQVNITRSEARSSIHNLGANIWQMDFAQMWYVGMLFLVEFADWNGQTAIGYGCSQSVSKQNNGRTDSMQYHTGTTAANRTTYGFTQYRNIEGWWDNVFDWMDGCYYNSNGLNVIKNPAQFSDSANGVLVGKPAGSGYPSDLAIPTQDGMEWALYPSESGGSTTTYVPDGWGFGGSVPCLLHGGSYNRYLNYGPFYVVYSTASSSSIGCRLQERPPKAA